MMKAVFSDLDGTILDHYTYSYKEALPGINLLKKKGAPLVLVSSKTFAEMKDLHRELGLSYPFIFEGGNGIGYPGRNRDNDYSPVVTGIETGILLIKMDLLRKAVEIPIIPLYEMSREEIMKRTGLSLKSAALAKERLSSIPFIPASPQQIDINKANSRLFKDNLMITKGGRFYHFSSVDSDKGKAVRKIIEQLKSEKTADLISVGIGDSENDLPMLAVVDMPFLVRKYDGSAIKTGINVRITEGRGPAGFTEAVRSVFCINENQ